MTARVLVCLATVAAAPLAAAADEGHPYKALKVGDYATYRVTTRGAEPGAAARITGTVSFVVTAKTDAEVTLRTSGTDNGKDVAAVEQRIDLTRPYDAAAGLPPGTDMAMEKTGAGVGQVTAGGRTYEARWETYKAKLKAGPGFEADHKVWLSTAAPFAMVKTEMTGTLLGEKFEVHIELTECGHKRD